jgi:hypothetical protein
MLDQEVMSRVAAYRGNPAPLQQRYAMSQNLVDLLALQKIKSEKEAAARQMQLQMAQQQSANGEAPMTIADQREKEVMDLTKRELAEQRGDTLKQQAQQKQNQFNKLMGGLAAAPGAQAVAQPKAMAAGGIVAFSDGGTSLDKARERAKAARQKLQSYGTTQRRNDPEGFAAAQQELQDAQSALKDAEGAYAAEMSAAGVDRPAFNRREVGALKGPMGLATLPAAAPAAAPEAPRAPMTPVDPREFGGLAALPGAQPPAPARPPAAPGAAPAVTRPATPAAAPAAAGPAPAAPTMPTGPAMIPGLRESISADVGIDPAARQKSEEERITGKLGLSPEEKVAIEQANAFRKRQFEEQYDPERQRREGIKQFLIGAGGRRYGEFGGGAQAGMAYDTTQRAAKLKEFEDMQKGIMEPFTKQRDATKMGIEGGIKGLEAASGQRRTGQTAGANIYGTETQAATSAEDRASREREGAANREIDKLKVQAQQAATAAAREGTDFARLQGHLNTIVTNRARAVEAVNKRFASQLSMLDMGLQANPKDKALLTQRGNLAAEIESEIDKVTRDFDDAKALVESRLYGKAGAGETGGYTVRKKEPTK